MNNKSRQLFILRVPGVFPAAGALPVRAAGAGAGTGAARPRGGAQRALLPRAPRLRRPREQRPVRPSAAFLQRSPSAELRLGPFLSRALLCIGWRTSLKMDITAFYDIISP